MFPTIQLGAARLGTFNLLVGAGLVCFVCLSIWQLRRLGIRGKQENLILQSIPFALIACVFAACLSDIAFRWRAFCANHAAVGMTFYGGLAGCIGFWLVYARLFGLDGRFLLNLFLPSIAIAQAFGRIGCFLGGCCFGKPVSASLGFVYPDGAPASLAYGSCHVFPVQLVEALWLFCIGIVLLSRVRFSRRATWYLLLMGGGRMVLEFFRGDVRGTVFPGCPLSPAQVMSVVALLGAFFLLKHEKPHPASGMPEMERSGSWTNV